MVRSCIFRALPVSRIYASQIGDQENGWNGDGQSNKGSDGVNNWPATVHPFTPSPRFSRRSSSERGMRQTPPIRLALMWPRLMSRYTERVERLSSVATLSTVSILGRDDLSIARLWTSCPWMSSPNMFPVVHARTLCPRKYTGVWSRIRTQ